MCVVQNILLSGDFEVMSLKSINKTKTVFTPNEKDTSVISQNDIIDVLPNPVLVEHGRKVCYKFKKTIDVFEN